MKYLFYLFIFLSLGSASLSAYCQVDRGGVPRSFQLQNVLKSQPQPLEIASPDLVSLIKEDIDDASLEKPYRVGIEVPVFISLNNTGQWDELPTGGRIWRAFIKCDQALGLGINYSELRLPEGSDIFVYTPDHNYVIGSISAAEVTQGYSFTTRPLSGDGLIVEYYEPQNIKGQAVIDISGLVYMYRGFEAQSVQNGKSAASGNCEVNVNCDEGMNWQNQKQGVVKILTKVVSKYFYCTGTLMNNTDQDFSGLLLTAAHCSKDGSTIASAEDYSHWIFYFNYESPGCMTSGGQEYTLIGAQKLAIGDTPTDIGSDFLLVKTLKSIPLQYKPYFCGWDAGSGSSSSGVSIHHPDGDIKKISTYTTLLSSGSWESTPNTHWIVQWAATPNGHGVTEGGSSGSPLFDDEGLVIGTLTGGLSSCDNKTGEDKYGKVPYSWESNGTTADLQLKPWLDPGNTGLLKMPGSFNEKFASAAFSVNSIIIPMGGTANFQDLSSGKPDTWHWYFQGGTPSESTEQNPSGIRFDYYGSKDVKLIVSNAYNSDTIARKDYIIVKAVVSPNPSTGSVNILTDMNKTGDIIIDVFDGYGKIAQHFQYAGASSPSYTINLPASGNVFILKVTQGDEVQTHKVIVVH